MEIIFSILLSFFVFLAYSETIHIKLSAVYHEFGIMSEFCMQNTYNVLYNIICISLFLWLTPCPIDTLPKFGFLPQNTVAVISACIFVVHCKEHIFIILCNFPFFKSLVLHMKHHIFWSICHTGSQKNFILLSFCYSVGH